jgi:group I intron endonuclease
MHYLYRITNQIDGKVYIGQTSNLSHRWAQHQYCANDGKNSHLYNAMRKYGIIHFLFEEIACCKTVEDVDFIEILLIEQYDSRNREKGYNIHQGGNNQSGENNPMYGRPVSQATREKHRKSMIGKNVGKKRTPEQKLRIKEGRSYGPLPEETKKKMSDVRKGQPNAGHFQLGHKPINGFKLGHIMSEETKKKISDSMKKRKSAEKETS